jgi:hypothetical protein
MGTDRRKLIVLAGLLVVLAGVVYRAVFTSPAHTPSSNPARAPAASRQNAAGAITAPDVHLDALNGERPKPIDVERNLFQFKPKPPVAAPPGRGTPLINVAPEVTNGPPPPPPIALKFIGTLREEGKPPIAVLSDGHGPPMYGIEGGTVAGRYRVLRIGVESIEMSYLDGRGRQTIRQTGS